MLEDSGAVVLLTQTHLRELFSEASLAVIDLQSGSEKWKGHSSANPGRDEVGLSSEHLAYIIYTSGSTGAPKGVMIEHRNVVRLFQVTESQFGFNEKDVWTLFHSYAFDFSVWEIWGALLYGGRLVVVGKEVARSPEEFYRLVCMQGVTVLNQTPTAFRQLMTVQGWSGEEHKLRYVIFGGEALEVATLKPWYEREENCATQLVNMYGITETTVHVTYRGLEAADVGRGGSPIGRPLADLRAYVLDGNRQPVPVGVVGELYVGGAGVARGYLNREELTAERFLADPFAVEAGARVYRTGDLGRWLSDGNLEFFGRNDHQVKIRGFRIELGEIEARLAEQAGVREAVVVALEEEGEKRLVAYYVPEETATEISTEVLRSGLSGVLPEHMVPAAYVKLERLPLTPNGKLDRKALPEPEASSYATREYEEPVGETEATIAAIWSEMLKVERVGRRDNFFQLGGDSIRSIVLISKARDLGLVITPDQVFKYQTVAALADALKSTQNVQPSSDASSTLIALSEEDRRSLPEGIQDAYGLTRLQLAMIFHNQLSGGQGTYHDVFSYQIRFREWHDETFRAVLDALSEKHPILRTSISLAGYSEPIQLVHREARIPLIVSDISSLDIVAQDRFVENWIEEEKQTSFDLETAPLLRIFLHKRSAETFQYTLSFHHAILDGWSVASFQTELLVNMSSALQKEKQILALNC